jgi:allophanate hydrolase
VLVDPTRQSLTSFETIDQSHAFSPAMETTMKLPSARPYAYTFRPESTAILIIDMQRDFLERGGYGELQCANDEIFASVRKIVPQTQEVLKAARELGLHVIHTREGHRPDLSDLPASKRLRQKFSPSGQHTIGIGDQGPMGKLLIRGEPGHGIIDDLKPFPGELVVDKPGKGSFWDTTLHRALLARGVTHLLIAGVTTECCVNATFREASDRGFECCVLTDCTAGFGSAFVDATLDMLCSYDGLFGFVSPSAALLSYARSKHPTPPSTPGFKGDLTLPSLRQQYENGETTVTEVAKEVESRVMEYQKKDPAVWTSLQTADQLQQAAKALEEQYRGHPLPPLYGVPFAVKDNIDVEGVITSSACEKASYMPEKSAKVVSALLKAGALFVGKTNLDQLAAGLSGCRSPYGYPRSVYDPDRISGGSSSGSAVAVAAGLVSFALGTDTAGSGRVPAAFNGIVGFKPTKGTLSAAGLVPACRSLDTISILAPTVDIARVVWLAADEGPDLSDPFAKVQQALPLWHVDFRGIQKGGFVFGVPPSSALTACTPAFREQFRLAVERLQRAGGTPQEVDWTPFEGGSRLLYDGALMNERIHCANVDFLQSHGDDLHPTTFKLFQAAMARDIKPWDVYRDQHLQAEYTRQAALAFQKIDVLLVPTTTCHPTVAEMEGDPLALNARLGEYTHFANVLDLCGVAVNAGYHEEVPGKSLPFGVSMIGASGTDGKVFDIARIFEMTS